MFSRTTVYVLILGHWVSQLSYLPLLICSSQFPFTYLMLIAVYFIKHVNNDDTVNCITRSDRLLLVLGCIMTSSLFLVNCLTEHFVTWQLVCNFWCVHFVSPNKNKPFCQVIVVMLEPKAMAFCSLKLCHAKYMFMCVGLVLYFADICFKKERESECSSSYGSVCEYCIFCTMDHCCWSLVLETKLCIFAQRSS